MKKLKKWLIHKLGGMTLEEHRRKMSLTTAGVVKRELQIRRLTSSAVIMPDVPEGFVKYRVMDGMMKEIDRVGGIYYHKNTVVGSEVMAGEMMVVLLDKENGFD